MRPDELRTLLRDEADRARPSSGALEEIYERIGHGRSARRRARTIGLVAASVVLLAAIVGALTLVEFGHTPVEIDPVGKGPERTQPSAESGAYDPTEDLRDMGIAAHPDYQHLIEATPELCDWVADVADGSADARVRSGTPAQERRSAVHAAINREGDYNGDGLYASVAWSCIAQRCPATPDNHVGGGGWMDGEPWQDPSAHADLGPDAPWPCATDDYV